MSKPYAIARYTVCAFDGADTLHVRLVDDQPGVVEVVAADEPDCRVTLGVDEIPALIEALRGMQRADRKARREMAE